jgi:hypothetical protein
MNHVYTLLCRGVSIDQETNVVSVFGIVEELAAVVSPKGGEEQDKKLHFALSLSFEVITLWCRTNDDVPEKGFAQLEIINPSGELLSAHQYVVDLTEHQRNRSRGQLIGFPATVSGRYAFRISKRPSEDADWQIEYVYPVSVKMPSPVPGNVDGSAAKHS